MIVKNTKSAFEKMRALQEEQRFSSKMERDAQAGVDRLFEKGKPFLTEEVLQEVVEEVRRDPQTDIRKLPGFDPLNPDPFYRELARERCFYKLMWEFLRMIPQERETAARVLAKNSFCFEKDHWIFEDPYLAMLEEEKKEEDALFEWGRVTLNPYLIFAYSCPVQVEGSGVFVPRFGYFEKSFSYPILVRKAKKGEEVALALSPSEMIEAKEAISNAKGKLLVLGLQMGYFPFMAARKEEVLHLTIVEKDKDLVEFFKQQILPKMNKEQQEKIELVCMDPEEYLSKMDPKEKSFDFCYIDVWKSEEGLRVDEYLHFKKLLAPFRRMEKCFFMEEIFLFRLMGVTFDLMIHEYLRGVGNKEKTLSEDILKEEPYASLAAAFKKVQMESEKDILAFFKMNSIKEYLEKSFR